MTDRSMRLILALCVASPLVAAPAGAQVVEYAAGRTKYHMTTASKGSQTSPMGSQDFALDVDQKFTVEMMRHAKDTVMATFTLDSIRINASTPTPDATALHGLKWSALVSPTGKFYSSKNPEGVNPVLAQFIDGIPKVLPRFRSGLAAGSTWSDTTTDKMSVQGVDMDRTEIANYIVTGDTTIGGEKALKVQRTASLKAAGSGTMQGAAISMETTSASAGAFYITPKGAFLGTDRSDDVDLKITVLAQNLEVAIKQKIVTKIEAMK